MTARSHVRESAGQRRNERLVLRCLRQAGAASKPDLAKQIALTPQAVHGIVDGLLDAGLVKAGGRREGLVGHPSTLYSIRPDGAYAIGVVVGPHRVETSLVNFVGQMIYRGQAAYPKLDRTNAFEAVLSAIEAALAHARSAGIDAGRIAGGGIVTATDDLGLAIEDVLASALQRRADIRLPVYFERQVVAEALFLATFSPVPTPPTCLFVTVGHDVDGCLMLDGSVRAARTRRGRFQALPISDTGTVGDVVGFANLATRLGIDQPLDMSTEAFFRAAQSRPSVFEGWLEDSAAALATTIAAAHALHDLDRVFVSFAPPVSVGDALLGKIGARLRDRTRAGIEYPDVHRVAAPAESSALPAATIAIHRLYAPGGREGLRAPPGD